MQVLSELFDLLRLRASVYNNAKFCGEWQGNEHVLGQTCFHMPTEGDCLLKLSKHDDVLLQQGDVVFFPYEIAHVLCPTKTQVVKTPSRVEYPNAKNVEGTGMLCAQFIFEHQGINRVLDQLPSYFIVKNNIATPWLNSLLELIVAESHASNSSIILNRLCELLFMQSLRHFLSEAQEPAGFMAIYANQKLNKAVEAIHREPEKPWNLEELAKLVHMSRTTFASHFKLASGWTAMQYLTWWRMQLAWRKLREGNSVASVASAVGYHSDASFSRAFKREFNVNVGQVRKGILDTNAIQ